MNYTCFIVDDEPIAVDILRTYLQRLEGFQVLDGFTNPIKAFESLQDRAVDLLFLDIQMPELTGLELLQSLRNRPEVILTTAYREFALEGFEFDVVDYLLKPISFNRFLKALDKFHARKNSQINTTLGSSIVQEGDLPHFFVRAERKNVKVYYHEILYLESLKDYVRIVTTSGKVRTKETLTHFEKTLPSASFLRIHRSFIVAKDKITAHSSDGLEVGQQLLPLGRMYKLAVEKILYL